MKTPASSSRARPSVRLSLTKALVTIGRLCLVALAGLFWGALAGSQAQGTVLSPTFSSASDVGLTSDGFSTSGMTLGVITLNFAPAVGTNLTVVNNTGLSFIQGTFSNLAQGQAVALNYGGATYRFVVNYHGGTGNDLVLQWAAVLPLAWGSNAIGQLGSNGIADGLVPGTVSTAGVLAGKMVIAMSAGYDHSLALCSDGTLAAWGGNDHGQLGNAGTASSLVPVAVDPAGVLAGKTVVAVAAGVFQSLALCSDGTLAAWGWNLYGQLGNNSTADSAEPVAVDLSGVLTSKTVVAVAAGNYHCLALCSDGTLAAWGDNEDGQMGVSGISQSNVPVTVNMAGLLFGKTVKAVAAGAAHTLVLCSDGTLAAWGSNQFGQLGNTSTTDSIGPVLVDTSGVLYGKTPATIAAGAQHNLAVCSDGTIVAWGSNASGELGNDSTTDSSFPVAVNTAGALAGETVIAVAAGASHSLALCSDGTLAVWGGNDSGQLCDDGTVDSAVPVIVTAALLAADARFVMAASGPSSSHSLGLGAVQPAPRIAVEQPAGTGLVSGGSTLDFGGSPVGTGVAKTFTIKNQGTAPLTVSVSIDGVNAADFLFTSSPFPSVDAGSSTMFDVTFMTKGAALSGRSGTLHIASNDANTALFDINLTGTASGTLTAAYTTGLEVPVTTSSFTATGSTATFALNYAPTPGTTLMVVNNLGQGFIHGTFNGLAQGQKVALTYNGVIYHFAANYYGGTGNDLVLQWAATLPVAWGYNFDGELGNNSTNDSHVPLTVSTAGVLAGKTVVAVAAGDLHSLALCSDGTVAAWGYNLDGELGNNSTTDSLVPVAVDMSGVLAGKIVVAVAAGDQHSLALCSDGTVAAWGYNVDGELGSGGTTPSLVPVAVNTSGVLAGRTIIAVAAGASHSLALCSDGTLAAWGYNKFGQIGNNSVIASLVPVAVDASGLLSGRTVVALAAGAAHSLALCSDGTLAAWGYNIFGQLGNNSTTKSLVPVAVDESGLLSGKTVVGLAAGAYHSLALCSDGTVAAWGSNTAGQLGDGSTTRSLVPVAVNASGMLAGKTVIALAAGASHSLALCSDGTLAAWGSNGSGELGDNSTTSTSVPVAVVAAPLAAGSRFVVCMSGQSASYSLGLVALPPAPMLVVEQPAGTSLVNDSTVDFGFNPVGTGVPVTFVVKNTGAAPLTISSATIDGTNAADFTLTTLPATAIAGESSTALTITFTAGAAFNRSATLHIASDDPDSPEFDVGLTGGGTGTLTATYTTGLEVPLSANGFTATGSSVNVVLNFVPAAGTTLMVVNNTGAAPIKGAFSNLTEGQDVTLTYNLADYHFVASYVGGTGNDLVLHRVIPIISVEQPAGTALTSGTSTVNFGSSAVNVGVTRTFTISNGGNAPLTLSSITIDGANSALFTVTTQAASTVAAGGSSTFTVTFTPTAVLASRIGVLHVVSNDPLTGSFNINLTGTGTGPLITAQPVSLLVGVGQRADFTAAASGLNLTFKWLKNNVGIAGAPGSSYSIAAAALTSAAVYTAEAVNTYGTAISAAANLGVVSQAPVTVAVVNGNTVTLTVSAAGPGLIYQWLKNGVALSNGKNLVNALGTIAGATASKLTITKAIVADASTYTCVVSMYNPQNPGNYLSLASGAFTVNVTIKPVLDAFAPGPWIVSGTVADQITARNNPTAFAVTGLPAGVTVNTKTGQLGGKPTVAITSATPYHLSITASNAAGASVAAKVDVIVQPLHSNAVGTFNGLVDRDAILSSGYGGTLNVVSLNTGVFTGKLTLGALSYSFTAQHLDATVAGVTTPAKITMVRALPLHNLTLDLTFHHDTVGDIPNVGKVDGTVTDVSLPGSPVSLLAWRRAPPPAFATVYTAALQVDPALAGTADPHEANILYPQGDGFGTLTVTAAGAASWSGKMSDGMVTTASVTMGPHGEVPLHFMLYTNYTGSAHGWVQASGTDPNQLLDNLGTFDWMKSGQAGPTLNYKHGFPLHHLTVIGAKYLKPTAASPLVLGILPPALPGGINARLLFSEGGLAALTYAGPPAVSLVAAAHTADLTNHGAFRLAGTATANSVSLPNPNPATFAVSISATTGAFSGSFILHGDQDPTKATSFLINRTGLFSGVCVTRSTGPPALTQGVGYFLLPELQPPPGLSVTASPLLSGKVLLLWEQ